MDNLKIYYINLDESKKRDNFMQKQFKNLAIEAIRFSAVNGKSLDKKVISDIYSKFSIKEHYSKPKIGEIGIFYSHISLWKEISKQKEDFALILEDDVVIEKKLIEYLPLILKNLKQNQMLDLNGKKGFYKIDEKKIDEELSFIKYLTPTLGMQGRIIGKECAKNLLNIFLEYKKPIDTMLQDVFWHKNEIFSTNIKFLKHSTKEVGGSTIQKVNINFYDKIKREFLRPVYRGVTHIRNFMYYKGFK